MINFYNEFNFCYFCNKHIKKINDLFFIEIKQEDQRLKSCSKCHYDYNKIILEALK